uniref:Uncharacterized protein n=1 Tax=Amphimedon queenslandica TaxID=400682 RepID=A0A1X7TMU3_AMPQE
MRAFYSILFVNFITCTCLVLCLLQDYLPVDQEELRDYVQARLKVFYEEELDVLLVPFYEVLDHVLCIDRIFKLQQGLSGAGKTTLSSSVAWINGLSVFQ